MNAEICCGVNDLSSILTDQSDPMWRLIERMVRSTFVTACRLATSPTRTSPDLANATTEGVVRAPSALAMTVGSPPSRTATTLFVVPRSMPTARAMSDYLRVIRPVEPAELSVVWPHPRGAGPCLKILEPVRLKSDIGFNEH